MFVVVNGTLKLRCTRLPVLFPKSGVEDLERPFRIFTLKVFMSYANPHWELMFQIQSKIPPQWTPGTYAEAFVSPVIIQKDQAFKLDSGN